MNDSETAGCGERGDSRESSLLPLQLGNYKIKGHRIVTTHLDVVWPVNVTKKTHSSREHSASIVTIKER